MNQLKNHIPLALLSLLVLKQLIVGTNLSEMGVAIAVAGLVGLREHLEKQKNIHEVQAHVNKELEDIKHIVKTQNDVIEKMAKALDENRNSVASLKMSQGMRKGA